MVALVISRVGPGPGIGLYAGAGIPKEINKVIFEKSQFSAPITLTLPCEDDPRAIERLKGPHHLMPAFSSRLSSVNVFHRGLLDILIQRGFVNVEKIKVSWSTFGRPGSRIDDVFTYSEKVRYLRQSRRLDL
jgi:hypothetical protein